MTIKLLKRLESEKKISPPPWLIDNTLYLNIHGSELYGCNLTSSDKDIYGVCLPPKYIAFPHTAGYINGFDPQPNFENWQQHCVDIYDFQVFNITRFLRLALDGNPNVTECLFAPQDCILHRSELFQPVLDMKEEFLSKKSIPKFRGYMLSQLTKMKSIERVGKRKEVIEQYGYDLKFASHVIRLGYYCEQILTNRYIDLRRDKEVLNAIKLGQFKLKDVEDLAQSIILNIDKLLINSKIPDNPNEEKVRDCLLSILKQHYSVEIESKGRAERKLDAIRKIILD